MNLYSEHYNKISIFRNNFEKILEKLKSKSDSTTKLKYALCAANYFVEYNTGYFTSSILEKFFIDFANNIKIDLKNINYKKNSILHIMSEGYKTGGHTRVVERWIENAPDNQTHSVIFTWKNTINLSVLENNVKNKNGKYISLGDIDNITEKATILRKTAMEYEYVVLHTHMQDATPIIAFGTEEFTRPVFLYNHASHMPWLGKSIADLVLDLKESDEVTIHKRKINNTFFMGIPTKKTSFTKTINKNEARKKLNIPLDKKIIVSSGSMSRYINISGNDFTDYLNAIMDDDTYCYVIGVGRNPENTSWEKIKKETNNRVITFDLIDFDKGYLDYLMAADLYLDSYPLCGGTATIDAITCGAPVLTLNSAYPQFDYLAKTSAFCKTKEEFINKAKRILNDKDYANNILEEVKDSLKQYQSIDAWNKRIEKLFEIAPKKHKIQRLVEGNDYCENNDLSVLCNAVHNDKFLKIQKHKRFKYIDIIYIMKYGKLYKTKGIPFIFQIFSHETEYKKTKVYKLFNKTIFIKHKNKVIN